MKAQNEMSMSFESRSSNEGFARCAVSGFITQLDPTISEVNDIKTAVSEAVTNCVVHAYRNTIGKIYINVKIKENFVVVIKVRDTGCGIGDIKQAMQPLFTTAPSDERAGLGFAVMQSFMDKVSVRSKVGKGTTVTFEKRLSCRVGNG